MSMYNLVSKHVFRVASIIYSLYEMLALLVMRLFRWGICHDTKTTHPQCIQWHSKVLQLLDQFTKYKYILVLMMSSIKLNRDFWRSGELHSWERISQKVDFHFSKGPESLKNLGRYLISVEKDQFGCLNFIEQFLRWGAWNGIFMYHAAVHFNSSKMAHITIHEHSSL